MKYNEIILIFNVPVNNRYFDKENIIWETVRALWNLLLKKVVGYILYKNIKSGLSVGNYVYIVGKYEIA